MLQSLHSIEKSKTKEETHIHHGKDTAIKIHRKAIDIYHYYILRFLNCHLYNSSKAFKTILFQSDGLSYDYIYGYQLLAMNAKEHRYQTKFKNRNSTVMQASSQIA